MQYFARNYPKEVAGCARRLDTLAQGLSLANAANTPYAGRSAVTLFMPWIMRRELGDSSTAGEQVHASRRLSMYHHRAFEHARSGGRNAGGTRVSRSAAG